MPANKDSYPSGGHPLVIVLLIATMTLFVVAQQTARRGLSPETLIFSGMLVFVILITLIGMGKGNSTAALTRLGESFLDLLRRLVGKS